MYDLKGDWRFFMNKKGELSLSVTDKTEYIKQQTMGDSIIGKIPDGLISDTREADKIAEEYERKKRNEIMQAENEKQKKQWEEMFNNPTMKDKTLNERILNIFHENGDLISDKWAVIDDFKHPDVANEIEKLILSEIEKAFDAGMEYGKEYNNPLPMDSLPNKEEYIKSIIK